MKIPALLSVLLAGAVVAFAASTEDRLVTRYLQYRNFTRLTTEKIDIAESVRMMCLDPKMIHGPHIEPGIHLYASSSAIAVRKTSTTPRYAIGTLLVKEKFDTKDAAAPSLITVMEKTANQGRVDDWRFTMIRLADRSIVRDTARMSCAECHARYTRTDFVSQVTDDLLAKFTQPPGPKTP